jgi:hypothetical protein
VSSDTSRHGVRLGTVQETLLIPLYGRAVDQQREEPVLRDPRAADLIGAIDLDLPDVIDLRQTLFAAFPEAPRRTMLAASVTEPTWSQAVAADRGGPVLLSAGAVLPFLPADEVRRTSPCSPGTSPAHGWRWTPQARRSSPTRTATTRSARSRPACAGPARPHRGHGLAARHPAARLPHADHPSAGAGRRPAGLVPRESRRPGRAAPHRSPTTASTSSGCPEQERTA